jgi:4-carboxymuconolactone decarboxylase
MPRLPLPADGPMTPEQQRVHDFVKGRSKGNYVGAPYQVALHCPAFLEKWQQVGEQLRYHTSLPPRLSELAILVTARHWNCQYEWHAHESHARKAGLPDAVIEAVRRGKRPPSMSADEEAVHDYCRELHENRMVSDGVYRRVLDRHGAAGAVELTALIGHYAMIAMMLNAHDYTLPAGTESPLPARDV